MEVKSPDTQLSVTVPATYRRPTPLLPRVSSITPVSPDDIVDCVELHGGKTKEVSSQIIRYSPPDSLRPRGKGQLIDIWA